MPITCRLEVPHRSSKCGIGYGLLRNSHLARSALSTLFGCERQYCVPSRIVYTHLNILQYCYNQDIKIRVPPSYDDPWVWTCWRIRWPENAHQSIAHDYINITSRKILCALVVREQICHLRRFGGAERVLACSDV